MTEATTEAITETTAPSPYEIGSCRLTWVQEDRRIRRATINKHRTAGVKGDRARSGLWGPEGRSMSLVAAISGLSVSTVYRVLTGDRLPNVSTLTKLAIGMAMTVDDVVGMLGLRMEQ